MRKVVVKNDGVKAEGLYGSVVLKPHPEGGLIIKVAPDVNVGWEVSFCTAREEYAEIRIEKGSATRD